MKKLIGIILGSLMIFALNTTVLQAAEYEITVCVDDTTAGDVAMVEDFMNSAADGAKASKSLRRVAMAAVGEIDLALNARVDSYGSLILDDGGLIGLVEGDSVTVRGEDCTNVGAETGKGTLTIIFNNLDDRPGRCRPTSMKWTVCEGNSCLTTTVDIPRMVIKR